ncbi:MAG: permease [Ruminococcus flavefaciens]|nr:permease [Ruminococcus flavefaciens]
MELISAGSFSIGIKEITFLMFTVFLITTVGYLLGRITIKGVSLGTAGVFIVSLLYGCFFYSNLGDNLLVGDATYVGKALKVVENLGLILFVTSVGFIAGPNFFGNFKKNFKSYVLLALVVIIAGGLACGGCILIDTGISGDSKEESASMLVGLLSGSLTSTPAFSAAKATVAERANGETLEELVTVGHGIAYLFGVIGVVLFVQLVPKFMKANMAEERKLLVAADTGEKKKKTGKLIEMDEFGFMPFALAAILGIFVGSIKFGNFSLTTTGGCLLVSLIFGHFGNFGAMSVTPKENTLKVFREFGLMLFLIGAGVAGGASFVEHFKAVYFLYGIVMTLVPMIIGFIFAKYVLKLSLLNNLGSITGGMTSTPALGTLISTAGTENVASAYAATYPVALIAVVVVSQVLLMVFK